MNIITITDFQNKYLDPYARLTEAQLLNKDHPEDGIFIAESPKVIERALQAGYEPLSALVEDRHIEGEAREILPLLGDIPIYTASFDVLKQLTGFALTRGMLCAMKRRQIPSTETLLRDTKRIVILENIMNPTNVGAIFRSAAALDMDGVILTSGCSNPLYRRSIRVSMGTVFQIPWTIMDTSLPWPSAGLNLLKSCGFKTASMALKDDSVDIDDETLLSEEKIAVIMGTEGDGLSAETIAGSDYTVCIPMAHGVDSLNVAAASAIAFWQLSRK